MTDDTDSTTAPTRPAAADETTDSAGAMRARTWTVAANYRDPADYDIPALPDWTVYRDEDGTLAFASEGEAFLTARDPVDVRR
ncbi:hypothetical protein [Halorarius halobius]|uniref:hypothetical protein n=1 Tax=Halorarius halobius TaxID=2962671 RepID=UPI0020CC4B2A|nr:hypothetical protein [Halorarius halobius]